MRRVLLVAAAVATVSCAVPMVANADSYVPTGPIVADSGFRPQPNGFAFENYTSDKPYSAGIGVHEMRALFGDGVCGSQPASDDCALTPPALQWETKENTSMAGGHCYGFSVTALRIFAKQLDSTPLAPPQLAPPPPADGSPPPPVTPPTAASLVIQDPATSTINWPLAHAIAYYFAFQELDSVAAAAVKGTPAQILQKLMELLPGTTAKEQYSMSVFKPGFKDGHEITPYAIEDLGGGRDSVLVYDNNYPLETHQLLIDTNLNTWSYQAAPNPGQQPDLYQGDATTGTMQLDPTTPGVGVQPCPFCAPANGATALDGRSAQARRAGAVEVSLTGNQSRHGHLLIQDRRGGTIGYRAGKLVTRMVGARVIAPTLDIPARAGTPEPRYRLPAGRAYKITLDNSYTGATDVEGIQITGPGFAATANSIRLSRGEKLTLTLAADGHRIAISSNRSVPAPVLSLGAQETGPDHSLSLRRRNRLGAHKMLTLTMNTRTDKLTIGGPPASYDVVMRYVNAKGAKTWARRAVDVGAVDRHNQASLDYASYNGDSSATDGITLEGAGGQPEQLQSEVPADASSSDVLGDFIDNQSYTPPPPDPYADPTDGGGDQVPPDPGTTP